MLNESIQYKKLIDIEERKLNHMLQSSKIDLNITHNNGQLNLETTKIAEGLGIISPIWHEKMKANIIKIFDNDTPSK